MLQIIQLLLHRQPHLPAFISQIRVTAEQQIFFLVSGRLSELIPVRDIKSARECHPFKGHLKHQSNCHHSRWYVLQRLLSFLFPSYPRMELLVNHWN